MNKELEEAIERLEVYCLFNSEQFKNDVETVKSAIECKEKLEKVVKLLKTKKPAFDLLEELEVDIKAGYADYLVDIEDEILYDNEKFTETEFNLLKDMLE